MLAKRGSTRGAQGWAGLLAALVACAAVAAAASAAARYSVEAKTVVVPPDSTKRGVVRCDRGSQLTGGGFAARNLNLSDVVIEPFLPLNRRSFEVGGASFDSDADEFVAYAVCDARGSYELRTKRGTARSGQRISIRARCPRGSMVTGGGAAVGNRAADIVASRPAGKRKWLATAVLGGVGETARFRARAICSKVPGSYRTVWSSAPTPTPRHAARGLSANVAVRATCPRGERLIGGGFSVSGSDSGRITISRPKGRHWRVLLSSTLVGSDQQTRAYARCRLNS